jgi:hypothetical protein
MVMAVVATNIMDKLHIRCAFFTPNRTWSPNYSEKKTGFVRILEA